MVKTDLLSHRILIFQIPLLCFHSVSVHTLSHMLGAHLAEGRSSWSRWSAILLLALSLQGSCAHFELCCGWKDKLTTCMKSTHTESPLMDQWWRNHSKYIILARTLTDIDSPTFSLMKHLWFLQSSQFLYFVLSSHNSVRFDRMVRFILVPPNDFTFVYNYNYYFLKNNDCWMLLLMLLVSLVFSAFLHFLI